jgi:translation initiation factor IF-2
MKTLTELSGSVIRVAAGAIAEARRSLPSDEKPAAPALPEAPAKGAGAATGESPAETAASVEAPAALPVATSAQSAPTPRREAESGAAKEAIDAAVANATGLSGDRLTMLQGAVEAVGRRTADVRLVRVFGLEEQVTGATKVGAYQYVVDLFPASMRQVTGPGDESGRRVGGRRGGRGGGDRGVKGGAVGGFSMDSLREDRKNERGRGGPGGGRRSGGGRGGPVGSPRGAPKK